MRRNILYILLIAAFLVACITYARSFTSWRQRAHLAPLQNIQIVRQESIDDTLLVHGRALSGELPQALRASGWELRELERGSMNFANAIGSGGGRIKSQTIRRIFEVHSDETYLVLVMTYEDPREGIIFLEAIGR